jgi:hypothetical protein
MIWSILANFTKISERRKASRQKIISILADTFRFVLFCAQPFVRRQINVHNKLVILPARINEINFNLIYRLLFRESTTKNIIDCARKHLFLDALSIRSVADNIGIRLIRNYWANVASVSINIFRRAQFRRHFSRIGQFTLSPCCIFKSLVISSGFQSPESTRIFCFLSDFFLVMWPRSSQIFVKYLPVGFACTTPELESSKHPFQILASCTCMQNLRGLRSNPFGWKFAPSREVA